MRDELLDLAEKACAGRLGADENRRLNTLLREGDGNRRDYLDYVGIHARLAWELGPRAPAALRRRIPWPSLAAAALLLAMLVTILKPAAERPAPPAAGGFLNNPRLDQVEIWPAAPGLVVDGDLSDWPARGRFKADCLPHAGPDRSLEAQMAHDPRFLYLSARVRDPFPMRNGFDPLSEAASAWMGGGVQVRLSTDRTRPWPVMADHLEVRRQASREATPGDLAGSIVHLTLWSYAPGGEPCLHIAYGMGFDRDRVNPLGFRGVFKPDGAGYRLEYAVPWDLLGAGSDPPRAGDVLAAMWTVNWSDESGRRPLGQLVEILNPARPETRWSFMRASDWGKAIYQ